MKKYFIIGIGFIILIAMLFIFNKPSAGGLLNSTSFINQYKNTPGAVMIDVRTPAEFNAGHIASAINIDYYDSDSFTREIKKLDKSKTYFVYCRSGNRSSKAILIMKDNLIRNTFDLRGGVVSAPKLLN